MTISRRAVLSRSARAMALLGFGGGLLNFTRTSALAQAGADYKALVCVFLNGGNDGNNTIVPLVTGAYQPYAAARAGLVIPQASLRPIATPGGQQYGLHPQLVGLQRLFGERKAAVVANVGVLTRPTTRAEYLAQTAALPRNLFSHIDQQMQWQTAEPAGNATTGWAGRTADRMAGANLPLGFPVVLSTAGNALFGVGQQEIAASVTPGVPSGVFGVDASPIAVARLRALEELLALGSGALLIQAASQTTREGLRISRLLDHALATGGPLTTQFPPTVLGRQVEEVARIIRVRQELGVTRQIFFCSMEGFDTHVGLVPTQAKLLKELDDAVTALHSATMEMQVEHEVTTFTQSEFGRTLEPSSGSGCDHAWGNHHFVIGGAVNGGDIFGRFPTIALGGPDDAGARGVWIPTSSLDQYGATLSSWFGVPQADLPLVFPHLANFPSPTLGFLG